MKDLKEIYDTLFAILRKHDPILQVRKNSGENAEFAGTKEVMQGKQKVDGHYFASLMTKPKDIRFYFFPIYTHADEYNDVSDAVRKSLKGKSCFHIKSLDDNSIREIEGMIARGVQLYQRDGLI